MPFSTNNNATSLWMEFVAVRMGGDPKHLNKEADKHLPKNISPLWSADFDPIANQWVGGDMGKAIAAFGNPHAHQFVLDPPPNTIFSPPVAAPQIVVQSTSPAAMAAAAQVESQRYSSVDYLTGGKLDPKVRQYLKLAIREPANVANNLRMMQATNPNAYNELMKVIAGWASPVANFLPESLLVNWSKSEAKRYFSSDRFRHHQSKSGMALRGSHFHDMGLLPPTATKQRTTEVRGEFGTAAGILHFLSTKYQFKAGYELSGHHGVDQIWVDRNRSTGEVKRYLIAEAKGSASAKLGLTKSKGQQMSPRWVFKSMVELYLAGDKHQKSVADKVIASILSKAEYKSIKAARQAKGGVQHVDWSTDAVNKKVEVWGMMVQVLPGQNILRVTFFDSYNATD